MNLESFYLQIDQWTEKGIPYVFIVDFELKNPKLYRLDNIEKESIPISLCFPHYTFKNNEVIERVNDQSENALISIIQPDFDLYKKKFDRTQRLFNKLGVDVINLTSATQIELHQSLQAIYNLSSAKYKVYLEDCFVCFSPETFIRIDSNGEISSYPMKGTIDALLPNAADRILNHPKEEEEHRATVNLIIEELKQVADHVKIKRYRYLDKIKTSNNELYQVSSEVVGQLKGDYKKSYGSLLRKLLPAGSITGTPKQKALQIINEVEEYNRSYYTGVCGVFDGQTLDSCVLIRMIEKVGSAYFYKSGGGVTKKSKAQDEFEEIKNKIYVSMD